jgi:2-polyprenyl-6-hydroxyphenyl methylase/3-demethylubiquinone-9 3-methyltransferase
MPFHKLETKHVNELEDIKAFFDSCAHDYAWKHDHDKQSFCYRIGIIREAIRLERDHVLLDIGCGIGHYLHCLAGHVGGGIGIDLSDRMIAEAKKASASSPWPQKLDFRIDKAEVLWTVPDSSVHIAMCIGAFEHMVEKESVLKSAFRALRGGGRIILLTANGEYLWYRRIAPLLGLDTRHLSTDRFVTGEQLRTLLENAGFEDVSISYWTFIPKGDMHPILSHMLSVLDWLGTYFGTKTLRGGLMATAASPKRVTHTCPSSQS